jgi:hypothetical protein
MLLNGSGGPKRQKLSKDERNSCRLDDDCCGVRGALLWQASTHVSSVESCVCTLVDVSIRWGIADILSRGKEGRTG